MAFCSSLFHGRNRSFLSGFPSNFEGKLQLDGEEGTNHAKQDCVREREDASDGVPFLDDGRSPQR